MKRRETGAAQPIVVKQDPGAVHTGIAVCRVETQTKGATTKIIHHVLHTMQINHRWKAIRDGLTRRSSLRRSRRGRKTRYRPPRFNNRTKPKGWLPPSLRHRLETTMSWVDKLSRLTAVSNLAAESVRFDMAILQDPAISGLGYQYGTLHGSETREYVLETFGRKCAYCDKEHVPLNLDHVVAKSRGGSDRVSNLVPSCVGR